MRALRTDSPENKLSKNSGKDAGTERRQAGLEQLTSAIAYIWMNRSRLVRLCKRLWLR